MTLNLTMNDREELSPRITVFGVGGAGGNAVNNMIEQRLEGVEFVVANTDAQALQQNLSSVRLQIGAKVTQGLGAGARPSVGAAAAEETIEEIIDHLAGTHMCFITAGMGGGTGTGAAPIIAQAARELGVLTVGVVTKPFQFEGAKRMRQADEGIEALQKVVDTLIIIPNQNLFRLANEKTTFTEAFAMADDVLYQGVKGVTDLMVRPGLINLDFADVRAVMDEMGKAMMGTGEASGEDRAIKAAEKAIANPLLDEISLRGAKGVLINITGGYDMTLFELDEAANRIREEVDPEANIIVGSTLDTELEGLMRVSVVATGIDAGPISDTQPSRPRRGDAVMTQQAPAVAVAPQAAPAETVAQMPNAAASIDAPAPVAMAQTPAFAPVVPASVDDHETLGRSDDTPPPAYQPQSPDARAYAPQLTAAQQAALRARQDADDAAFAAASSPAPYAGQTRQPAGTPSPEVMARLSKALSRAVPARQPEPQPAPQPVAEKRFGGINSLISRMTGSQPEPQSRAMPPMRAAQPMNRFEDEMDAEQAVDRNEIPAFLRRQAN